MNEFVAIDKNDSLAIATNGVCLDVDLTDYDELTVHYKDGVFHFIAGEKEGYVVDGFQAGDIIPTNKTVEVPADTTTHAFSTREFKGRMSGRLKDTPIYMLNMALTEYKAAIVSEDLKGYSVLETWAVRFNVKPATVCGWMAKHSKKRALVQKSPLGSDLTFGELIKRAAFKADGIE